MVRTHRCSFCGREFTHGKGMLYVKNDGTLLWFCSRKCRIYMVEHGKDPRKLKWTKAG
ncbi:large subunit ribosomal protein L24e [Candidatus Caldarchaeum subterraneum]|uniref:Large ribosomal subunit protein eL24 n=1 Tax=Caldiarchaeum subterraneum TaxID=311458 RepID=E6N583_CALS0|nr:large subunit ribosomal protein L24e [Candidatus Caldarchaeum subterraneum]BAJ49276.1 large subunit ribosomal protein L24e [Candidatus Caldarchaeum subterraneum]BAJ50291.1 large subunit ribosomal protein L24e [Candidatus Caldarchaeum subterraneum]